MSTVFRALLANVGLTCLATVWPVTWQEDVNHALNLAKSCGVRVRNVEVAVILKKRKYMGSKGDIAGIYEVMRHKSGLNFE